MLHLLTQITEDFTRPDLLFAAPGDFTVNNVSIKNKDIQDSKLSEPPALQYITPLYKNAAQGVV